MKQGEIVRARSRKRVWLWVGLLIAVSLAGCLAEDDAPSGGAPGKGDDDGGSPGGNMSVDEEMTVDVDSFARSSLVYEGCSVQGLQMRLPAEFFAADLPEGFELASGDPLGATAVMEIVGLDCPTVLLDGVEHAGISEFRFHLDVIPPEEHESADAVRHMLLLDLVHSDEEVIALYQQWGLWASEGSTTMSSTDAVAARLGQVVVETMWDTFDMHSTVEAAEPSCQDSVMFRTFGLQGDQVTSYVDVQLDETCFAMGTGSVVFEPFGTDPESLAFWLLITGATSGLSFHSMDDSFRATQTHTSLIDTVMVISSSS